MGRTLQLLTGLPAILVLLYGQPSCAHQHKEDPPLYEELLFAELQEDRPEPTVEFPFDGLIDDEVSGEEGQLAVALTRPRALSWREFTTESRSESVGKPNDGYLRHGREMPREGTGFYRKNDRAPFGTDEAIAIVLWACSEMVRLYPGTVPAVIGNLSKEGGGRLKPHKSHRAGRDVDIGYYFNENQFVRGFTDATPDTMDAEKVWTLVELFLSTYQVEYIFIDQTLQEPLFEEALRRGWTESELEEIFEAPLGARPKHGLIRHSRGHKHHLHVRFKCDKSDGRCH
jgi:murein endopeptidase